MDPKQALRRLIGALADRDRTEAVHATEALAGWLRRGGFLPVIPDSTARAIEALIDEKVQP